MTYELWDGDTGNAIGGFDTEADALALVREAIARHGRSYVETWFLGSEDARGRSKLIADGIVLAERALATHHSSGRTRRTPVPV
jgi:hypothetical protein